MHEKTKNLSEREAAERLGVSRLTLWRAGNEVKSRS
jgi:predicted DNA-binding protein (UPF0251 family)